jgi:CDP-glycerol glycerophosphotransferase
MIKAILYKSQILSLPFYFFRLFPIKKNKIICSNFYGKGYGDSPKYIIDELLKRDEKKYDIVWVVKDKSITDFPQEIRTVKINTLKYIYELATSKVWIFNCRKNMSVKKRKGQFYIQTWHGGIAFKKIEKDAKNKLDSNYIAQAKDDSKAIDLIISNGKFCSQMYRRAFWYDEPKEILECGTPRNDILINADKEKIKKIVYDFYNFNEKDKVLIYAPTFRDVYVNNPYDIDFEKLREELNKKTNSNWRILIRLHPGEKNPERFIKFSENVLNACEYKDIQELILASELLITDYSSTMFESMLANIGVILYANDIESYQNERGTYFTFEELPFKLTTNNEELMKVIRELDFGEIQKEYDKFKASLGLIEEGTASKKIADIIENL